MYAWFIGINPNAERGELLSCVVTADTEREAIEVAREKLIDKLPENLTAMRLEGVRVKAKNRNWLLITHRRPV